jgi:hypothetical protein
MMKARSTSRRPIRALLVTSVIVVASLLSSTGIVSAACYWPNEGVAGYVTSPGSFTGYKGNQGIRTDPGTVAGVGYVHPTQLDVGPEGGDFVAIGTANGLGVLACADSYNSLWSAYVDGVYLGVYYCHDVVVNGYAAGSNPSFAIEWGWCPWDSQNLWTLYFGGALRSCEFGTSSSGAIVNSGLEVSGGTTIDYNIDVKYTNLRRRIAGSTLYSSPGTSFACIDPSYQYQSVSSSAHNDYLGTLQ